MQTAQLRRLAAEYGSHTPMYLFDMDELRSRAVKVRNALPANTELCYAIKANPFLMEGLQTTVQRFEVCSPGELQICRRRKIAGEQIVFSGVNKTAEDIEEAVDYGVHMLTIESKKHLREINDCAAQKGKTVKVLIRLTNGSQFGVDEKLLEEMIADREQYPGLHFAGIHFFTGTQKKAAKIYGELEQFMEFVQLLQEKYAYEPEIIEYGPGLPVCYFEGEDEQLEEELLNGLKEFLEKQAVCSRHRWVIELGRFLAASCGYYITRVADIKKNHGKNYCITDGGINHVNYYGQNMAMRVPGIEHISMNAGKEQTGEELDWTVCGSLCTTADVLVRKVSFKSLSEGDLLVFKKLGAYSVTEGIYLFLSRRMPKVYAYDEADGMRLLREGIETNIWNG